MKIFYTVAYKRGALLHADVVFCGFGSKITVGGVHLFDFMLVRIAGSMRGCLIFEA